jgi:hypothetical protein
MDWEKFRKSFPVTFGKKGKGPAAPPSPPPDEEPGPAPAEEPKPSMRSEQAGPAEVEDDFVGPPPPTGSDSDDDDSDSEDSDPYDIPTSYSVAIGGHTKVIWEFEMFHSECLHLTGCWIAGSYRHVD